MACRKKITKEIIIDGMKCMHCASAVESALKKIKDVKSVDVNLNEKSAKVLVFEGTDNSVLADAVTNAGFKVIEIK